MSTPGAGALPLPGQYLPDYQNAQHDPKQFKLMLEDIQSNFEQITLSGGIGAGTAAPARFTGTYAGTWTDFASYVPTYSKTGGVVVLEGAVTKSPSATFSPPDGILTLPAGFRPLTTIPFLCLAYGGTTGTTVGPVVVTVASSGTVQYEGGMTGGGLTNNLYYISLSGIVFKAAN